MILSRTGLKGWTGSPVPLKAAMICLASSRDRPPLPTTSPCPKLPLRPLCPPLRGPHARRALATPRRLRREADARALLHLLARGVDRPGLGEAPSAQIGGRDVGHGAAQRLAERGGVDRQEDHRLRGQR